MSKQTTISKHIKTPAYAKASAGRQAGLSFNTFYQLPVTNYQLPCTQATARGYTVLEIVIVAALTAMLMATLMRFVVVGYPFSKVTFLQARSNETATLQLKRISRELREVRPADNGAYPLVEMLPQRIVFYADVDGDPSIERVRYELVDTDLQRSIINPTGNPAKYDTGTEQVRTVATSIRNGNDPIFTYYGGNYPADSTPLTPVDLTEVKYIEFFLRIDVDPAVDPAAVEVRSQIQLRNLKTNLGQM